MKKDVERRGASAYCHKHTQETYITWIQKTLGFQISCVGGNKYCRVMKMRDLVKISFAIRSFARDFYM